MNRPFPTRTFKSGNSVAVRLPKEFGILPGTEVEMIQTGDRVTMRFTSDPVEAKRRWLEALDQIAQLPPVAEIEKREPIEFPNR